MLVDSKYDQMGHSGQPGTGPAGHGPAMARPERPSTVAGHVVPARVPLPQPTARPAGDRAMPGRR